MKEQYLLTVGRENKVDTKTNDGAQKGHQDSR